jgi:hypothetical protein
MPPPKNATDGVVSGAIPKPLPKSKGSHPNKNLAKNPKGPANEKPKVKSKDFAAEKLKDKFKARPDSKGGDRPKEVGSKDSTRPKEKVWAFWL